MDLKGLNRFIWAEDSNSLWFHFFPTVKGVRKFRGGKKPFSSMLRSREIVTHYSQAPSEAILKIAAGVEEFAATDWPECRLCDEVHRQVGGVFPIEDASEEVQGVDKVEWFRMVSFL